MSDKPKLKLTGQNGNAFMVLGLASRAARKAGWPKEKVDEFMAKAMSGNYRELRQSARHGWRVFRRQLKGGHYG